MKRKEEQQGLTPDSTEYKISTTLAGQIREATNGTLGDILTLIEASFPTESQSKAVKNLVKQMVWSLMNKNQHTIYRTFGQEPKQLGDPETYIMINGELIDPESSTATYYGTLAK